MRNLHPGVAVVGFTDKPSFQVEKLPGVKITSLDPQSISVKEYAATARRLLREGRSPGEIVDVWKFAALKLEWEVRLPCVPLDV